MAANFHNFPKAKVDAYKTIFNTAAHTVGKASNSISTIWRNRNSKIKAHEYARTAFERFWGDIDQAKCTLLTNNFKALKSAFIQGKDKKMDIYYDKDDPDKAYILEDDEATSPRAGDYTPHIYLCKALLTGYAASGTNSGLGSIVHEMSHLVLKTEDHKYGMKSCSELEWNKKKENADNYKYYTELFQLVILKTLPVLKDTYDLHHKPPR